VYYAYVIQSQCTGRFYTGSTAEVADRLRTTTREPRPPRGTAFHGPLFTRRHLPRARRRSDASGHSKPAKAATNVRLCYASPASAVAFGDRSRVQIPPPRPFFKKGPFFETQRASLFLTSACFAEALRG